MSLWHNRGSPKVKSIKVCLTKRSGGLIYRVWNSKHHQIYHCQNFRISSKSLLTMPTKNTAFFSLIQTSLRWRLLSTKTWSRFRSVLGKIKRPLFNSFPPSSKAIAQAKISKIKDKLIFPRSKSLIMAILEKLKCPIIPTPISVSPSSIPTAKKTPKRLATIEKHQCSTWLSLGDKKI